MRHLLFILIFFYPKCECYSQLKIEDLNDFPLSIYFDDYRDIKKYFSNEPKLLKGDVKDLYTIEYDDTPFDVFGSADYEFIFMNKLLTLVDIKLKFYYNETEKFKQTIQSLRNRLKSDFDKTLLKEYSDLNYFNSIDFMKKEGKGVYGNMDDSIRSNLNSKHFGQEFWNIKRSIHNDNRFMILGVSVGTTNKTKLDNHDYEYSGSCIFLNITLTNSKLQDLRNQYLDLDRYNLVQFREEKKIIKLKNENGVYKIPVKVNNSLTLDFVLDLGASDVSISPDVFSVLLKTGSIDPSDIIGKQSYKLADGSIVEHTVINLKSLTIGGIKLDNIKASVSDSNNSPLLLGQSALKKLGTYSIDNKKNELTIE